MAAAVTSLVLDVTTPHGFRAALERRGGLFAEFGRFLSLRTDLLPWEYAVQLEGIAASVAPLQPPEFKESLTQTFGAVAGEAIASLEMQPAWSTLSRCAYRARYLGKPVIIQAARTPQSAIDWAEFRSGIRAYRHRVTQRATSLATLEQFEDWVKLADNPQRERNYLESIAAFKGCYAYYPTLIPELSKNAFCCWTWPDAKPLIDYLAEGGDMVAFADFVLEQITFLAMVDADLDIHNLAVHQNRIVVRRATRLVGLPPGNAGAALRYISNVLQQNSRTAARILASLATAETELETRLTDKLSNLEPELKVDLKMSIPASIFENNWRALTAVYPEKRIFLDALHRNLMLVAFRNTKAKNPLLNGSDPVQEAFWPVLARTLRYKLNEYATPETIRNSVMISGTAFIEGLRVLQQLSDAVRDDNLRVNLQQPAEEQHDAAGNRQVFHGITLGLLLLVFLVALRWSGAASGYSVVLTLLAVVSGAALLWFLLRGE